MPDWKLEYGSRSLSFGDASGVHLTTEPELGSYEIRSDDASVPRGDGTLFGRDFIAGRSVALSFGVPGVSEADTRSKAAILARAWRGDGVRDVPGAVAALVSPAGRSIFGRPRRYASDDSGARFSSYISATADFTTVDDVWYGPAQSRSVSIAPVSSGGFVAPFVFPISTSGVTSQSTLVDVGGDVPTWPVFTVRGPVVNPVVEVVGVLRMQFAVTLAFDQTLVVDTRPWVRSIMRGTGSVAGSRSRQSTSLSEAGVPPGRYEVLLRGSSSSGSASLDMGWSDAFLTP